MPVWDRVIGVAAGLAGAAGVAASAAGAHAYSGTNVDTAGKMLLVHAAALLALSIPSRASTRMRQIAALVMAVGITLFAGDLLLRSIHATVLFPMAAPFGGLLLIASWLIAAVGAMAGRGQG
ncbi:DUF423 domain-containing protein [Chthonobacter albigriseus]|uniref:DUF423 domain-containing protein n=1 Tax=Chthonobacter albigriseus TaxID=1683161 RepID=UPI0015EED105|nr:DUF423 domain-containing protein [Chthonobacter albigriseus]